MSIVSTICLLDDFDYEGAFRRHIEAFTGTSLNGDFTLTKADDDTAGGYKVPEFDLWWAAVNHLDVTGFFAHLDAFEGGPTTGVLVVVHTGSPISGFKIWERRPPEEHR